MKEGLDEVAKDLISNLLLPKPEDRLGCGKKGEGRDYEALKAHKFFDGINWEKVGKEESPI